MSGIMQRRPITLYETLEALPSGGLSVRPWEEPGQAPELIDQLEALLRPAADTARQELAALAAQWAPEGETT